jgi:hypothetical protein
VTGKMLLNAITFIFLVDIFFKRRMMGWAGPVACMRENIRAYRILVINPEVKIPLRRHKEDGRKSCRLMRTEFI